MGIAVDGLISGIDTKGLLEQLLKVERQPIDVMNRRVAGITQKKTSYLELSALLLALKNRAAGLASSNGFNISRISSSNENLITATGSNATSYGTFNFTALRLAGMHQLVSSGFPDRDEAKVGIGEISFEMGATNLAPTNRLEELRGGRGIARGRVQISNRSGNAVTVDLGGALTIQDVADSINNASGLQVRAVVEKDRLVLQDQTGGAGTLHVAEVGEGTTAAELGILGTGTGSELRGSSLLEVTGATELKYLRDGLGVTQGTGNDFRISLRDTTSFEVELSGAGTLAEARQKIQDASGGKVTAAVAADGRRLVLTDLSTDAGGTFAVADLGSSRAAADLGITAASAGDTLQGRALLGNLGSVLLGNLRGGKGLNLGQVSLTDRAGNTAVVDLSGLESLDEVLAAINNNGSARISAMISPAGNGLTLRDLSGGTGTITVADVTGAAASQMGLAGAFNASSVKGSNLERQYLSLTTMLASLHGGKGVYAGKMRLTDSTGKSAVIDLSQSDDVRIDDVLEEINASGLGITASINATGNGLLLTDTAGGGGTLAVDEEGGGTTARDLGIKGMATSGSTFIDGAFAKKVTVAATDTLDDVARKINDLGFPVSAAVFSTGSGEQSFRLNLVSGVSGAAGKLTVDSSVAGLSFSTVHAAQDSVVLFGSSEGGARPLLVSSGSNTLTSLIPGVTLELQGTSSSPVAVTVTRDMGGLTAKVQDFADKYNAVVGKIAEQTKFVTVSDSQYQTGILFGDATVQQIRTDLKNLLLEPVQGMTPGKNLPGWVGLSFLPDGTISFDEYDFRQAVESDLDGVIQLFSQGLGSKEQLQKTSLKRLFAGEGLDPASLKITDGTGATATLDFSGVANLGQVLEIVNGAAGIRVQADLVDGRLVLYDRSGGNTSRFSVEDVGGTMASVLGIRTAVTTDKITSRDLDPEAKEGAGLSRILGFATRLDDRLAFITQSDNGSIMLAGDNLDKQIATMKERIATMETRVAATEERLRRDFMNMEIAMNKNQGILSSLNSQFQNLVSIGGSRKK